MVVKIKSWIAEFMYKILRMNCIQGKLGDFKRQ